MRYKEIMQSECEKKLIQYVRVDADIMVTPICQCGTPVVSCMKPEVVDKEYDSGSSCCCCKEPCPFRISQVLCIEIPVLFGVDVDVANHGICCGRPNIASDGECPCQCDNQ